MTKEEAISKLVIKKGFTHIEDSTIAHPIMQQWAKERDLDLMALLESMPKRLVGQKQKLVLRANCLYYEVNKTQYKLDIPDFSEFRRKRKRGNR